MTLPVSVTRPVMVKRARSADCSQNALGVPARRKYILSSAAASVTGTLAASVVQVAPSSDYSSEGG